MEIRWPQELRTPDVSRFDAADETDDPAAVIAFLEAAGTIPGLRALKAAMLERMRLGRARAALDAGCGFGADVAEMARRMPPGGKATGIDRSQAMISETRPPSAAGLVSAL